MSFSFDFVARSRQHALELLGKHSAANCPEAVRDFIATAIENMPDAKDGTVRLIKVSARGHLCVGKEWSAFSSAQIEVSPIESAGS